MKTFTVTAQRGTGPVWVLECQELGAVSQTRRLDRAAEEMREAIAYLAKLDESEISIDVVPVLAAELTDLQRQAEEQRRAAETAHRNAARATRELVKRMREQGYTLRDIAMILGVSHQHVGTLAA
ncbi:hypothetical protein MTQ17_09960 [Corynebacterium bovis]|uniref:hypothetical protein n=1 Tax=Corynebacterium bovis TaxID=36808 RepID=UPI003139890B